METYQLRTLSAFRALRANLTLLTAATRAERFAATSQRYEVLRERGCSSAHVEAVQRLVRRLGDMNSLYDSLYLQVIADVTDVWSKRLTRDPSIFSSIEEDIERLNKDECEVSTAFFDHQIGKIRRLLCITKDEEYLLDAPCPSCDVSLTTRPSVPVALRVIECVACGYACTNVAVV